MRKKRGTEVAFKALMTTLVVLLTVFCLNFTRLFSDLLEQINHQNIPLSIFLITICLIVAIGIVVSALLVIDTIKDIRKILKK